MKMQNKWDSSMSLEETKKIMTEVDRLKKLGDEDEATKLLRTIPLDPGYANDLKRFNGLQWLLAGNYNLTDVIRKYGEEWLHA